MTLDWQVFLTDDGGGRTYLEWMMEAWRWTLAVAGASWVVAMLTGAFFGTLRTLPNNPWLVRLANAWVEALACGTPIVITNAGGAREVLTDTNAGRIVDRTAGGVLAGGEGLGGEAGPAPLVFQLVEGVFRITTFPIQGGQGEDLVGQVGHEHLVFINQWLAGGGVWSCKEKAGFAGLFQAAAGAGVGFFLKAAA
jgi:ABC-type amino acid transport system permease subunit